MGKTQTLLRGTITGRFSPCLTEYLFVGMPIKRL